MFPENVQSIAGKPKECSCFPRTLYFPNKIYLLPSPNAGRCPEASFNFKVASPISPPRCVLMVLRALFFPFSPTLNQLLPPARPSRS